MKKDSNGGRIQENGDEKKGFDSPGENATVSGCFNNYYASTYF